MFKIYTSILLLVVLAKSSFIKSFHYHYHYNYHKSRLFLLSKNHGYSVVRSKSRNSTLDSDSTSTENEINSKTGETAAAAAAMPKNLKRKIQAKRPFLGHVVPKSSREGMKKEAGKNKRKNRGGSNTPKLYAQGKIYNFENNPSNLRIVAGLAKGKRLVSPDVYLRPMMGKVRQALFSTLISFGLFEKKGFIRHLDIFAGSGSVGLESLSRGATHCTFVDLSPNCCSAVHTNFELCKFSSSSSTTYDVQCCDAFTAIQNPSSVNINHGPYHIITICPPYEEIIYADLLQSLCNSSLLQEDTIIVIEYPIELRSLPHIVQSTHDTDAVNRSILVGVRNRKYGRTVLAMYIVNPSGRVINAESRPEEFGVA